MKFLSNVYLASLVLTVLIIIVVSYLFSDYDTEMKEYIKLLIYLFSGITLFMSYYKSYILSEHGYKPIDAAAEVFNEITDSQQLNGIMQPNSMLGGNEDELIIDNIPKSITCNNIV